MLLLRLLCCVFACMRICTCWARASTCVCTCLCLCVAGPEYLLTFNSSSTLLLFFPLMKNLAVKITSCVDQFYGSHWRWVNYTCFCVYHVASVQTEETNISSVYLLLFYINNFKSVMLASCYSIYHSGLCRVNRFLEGN